MRDWRSLSICMSLVLSICVECRLIRLRRLCTLSWCLIEALNQCGEAFDGFNPISTLLKMLSTIPVTSCEAELNFSALCQIKPFLRTTMTKRTFSALRQIKPFLRTTMTEGIFSALHQIKPFLRTTMTEDRLSDLTLLHIHRNTDLDDAKHPRKLQLL